MISKTYVSKTYVSRVPKSKVNKLGTDSGPIKLFKIITLITL